MKSILPFFRFAIVKKWQKEHQIQSSFFQDKKLNSNLIKLKFVKMQKLLLQFKSRIYRL